MNCHFSIKDFVQFSLLTIKRMKVITFKIYWYKIGTFHNLNVSNTFFKAVTCISKVEQRDVYSGIDNLIFVSTLCVTFFYVRNWGHSSQKIFRLRKNFAAHLKASYLKYALECKKVSTNDLFTDNFRYRRYFPTIFPEKVEFLWNLGFKIHLGVHNLTFVLYFTFALYCLATDLALDRTC